MTEERLFRGKTLESGCGQRLPRFRWVPLGVRVLRGQGRAVQPWQGDASPLAVVIEVLAGFLPLSGISSRREIMAKSSIYKLFF